MTARAPSPPMVSVIVCTRNRRESLRRTLEAMRRLEIPSALPWELIVVDNGSTDGTGALVASYDQMLPLQCVVEPRRGLSHARNAGLRAARGDVIAWTDDDCLPIPQWLARIAEEFARDPDLDVLGGRVELFDPRDRPHTIRTETQRTSFTSPYQLSALIVGCNMSLTRRAVAALGPFDTALGGGTPMGAGEDLDYLYRAFLRGLKIVFAPEVAVFHAHGRSSDADERAILRAYSIANGALLCKYILRGDRGMLKRLKSDIAYGSGQVRQALRERRVPGRALRHWWYTLVGMAGWIAGAPRRALDRRRTGQAAPVPEDETEAERRPVSV